MSHMEFYYLYYPFKWNMPLKLSTSIGWSSGRGCRQMGHCSLFHWRRWNRIHILAISWSGEKKCYLDSFINISIIKSPSYFTPEIAYQFKEWHLFHARHPFKREPIPQVCIRKAIFWKSLPTHTFSRARKRSTADEFVDYQYIVTDKLNVNNKNTLS